VYAFTLPESETQKGGVSWRKIIVTGATGGFGRSATQLLLERIAPTDLILTTRKPEQLADPPLAAVRRRISIIPKPSRRICRW
jgi:NADP-dependent 3-hydroxy acid dehydrogenase YdfG